MVRGTETQHPAREREAIQPMYQGRYLPRWISRAAGVLALALLAACASIGPQGGPPPSVDRAEHLASQGDNAGAARIFEELAAQNAGTDRDAMLLRAARAYLAGRLPDEAVRVLGGLALPLTPPQSLEQQLLNAEIELARGQVQPAWQLLAAMPPPGASPAAAQYWDLKRRAAFATGRPVDAVRAHTEEERWLTSADQRRASRLTLLAELREASERGMKVDPRAAADPLTRGWLELAGLSAEAARSPNAAVADIQAWRARYPEHPADEVVASELLGLHIAPAAPQPHLALLLPLSGQQAGNAASVRDGFLTGYYANPASQRPRVRIYDTTTTGAAEAITRASAEGAELIVGPLTREEVTAAADLTGTHPPILALNYLPPERVAPRGFYQFALSPEDEARQTARRILADGYKRGIALVPAGDWGTRVLAAFKDELIQDGGTLIDVATYDPARNDYAAAITQVLRIDESEARRKRLESVLGTRLPHAQFQPRRRADLAFIFAAGQVAAARQLRPQLRFYFAGDVPTYATSEAFEPDPNANQDMDGLIVPEMPWILGGALTESVRAAARDSWPTGGPRRNRLFAFGFDAYRLAATLRTHPADSAVSVEGLTGRLSIDAEHRVHRELDWAQVHGGEPRVLARAGN